MHPRVGGVINLSSQDLPGLLTSRAQWPVKSSSTVHVLTVLGLLLFADCADIVTQDFGVLCRTEATEAHHGLHSSSIIVFRNFNVVVVVVVLPHGLVALTQILVVAIPTAFSLIVLTTYFDGHGCARALRTSSGPSREISLSIVTPVSYWACAAASGRC